jgi:type IV pilus assembly protein PilE
MSTNHRSGFSLIELLATLLLAATLALLAFASYRAVLDRSRRLDARTALWHLASAEERHRLSFGRYAESLGEEATAEVLRFPARSQQGHYDLRIVTGDLETFTAEARPSGIQMRDQRCALLRIDATGAVLARDTAGRDATRECWS